MTYWTKERIDEQVQFERARQAEKFPEQETKPLTPAEFLAVWLEELGEVAKAVNDGDLSHAQVEAIQVIALGYKALQTGVFSPPEKVKVLDLANINKVLMDYSIYWNRCLDYPETLDGTELFAKFDNLLTLAQQMRYYLDDNKQD